MGGDADHSEEGAPGSLLVPAASPVTLLLALRVWREILADVGLGCPVGWNQNMCSFPVLEVTVHSLLVPVVLWGQTVSRRVRQGWFEPSSPSKGTLVCGTLWRLAHPHSWVPSGTAQETVETERPDLFGLKGWGPGRCQKSLWRVSGAALRQEAGVLRVEREGVPPGASPAGILAAVGSACCLSSALSLCLCCPCPAQRYCWRTETCSSDCFL